MDNLPAGSALDRAVNPDWMWDLPSLLLAQLVDDQRSIAWNQAPKGKRGPPPKPIPRPGHRPVTTRYSTPSGVDTTAEFDAWRASVLTK